MKISRRSFLILFGLLLLIAFGGTWFLNGPRKVNSEEHESDPTTDERTKRETTSKELIRDQRRPTESKSGSNDRPRLEHAEKLKLAVSEKNVTINFWGKVVDQNENPIQGARVTIRVRNWHVSPLITADTTFPKTETFTDADGRFNLLGSSGDSLTLESIEKEGYRLSPKTEKTFSYGQSPEPFFPDINNPVLIHMWKLLPAEALKTFRLSKTIPYDGTPVGVDLIQGKLVEGNDPQSDLRITLERSPSSIALTNRDPFDWHATVTAISGGIVVTDDEFMYLAPEDGYKEKFEIDMPKTATNWTPIISASFFIKGRNEQFYGRITIELRANYAGPKTGFTIDAALNLNGSKNLQP